MRLCVAASLAVGLACDVSASAHGNQPTRVTQDARTIRAFRLGQDHLTRLRQVSETMARNFKPAPERPRADAAIFVVLSMSFAYNEPFSDRTVTDMVRTIESGHADLHSAIRAAGLTTADYVLTQITLLLAYPVVAGEKAARPQVSANDIAVENVTFVKRHWTEVDSIMRELGAAAGPPQPAAPQVGLGGDSFQERALLPAMQSIAKGDLPDARRLAPVVLSDFEGCCAG